MTKKKKISQKDLNTWKHYLKNPQDIVDKDLPTKNSFSSNKYPDSYKINKTTRRIIRLFCFNKKKGIIAIKSNAKRITGTSML